MDARNLEQLLTELRESTLPPLPPTFQQKVWREIRLRKAKSGESHGAWLSWLLEPIFKPAMAVTALALAIILGIGLGTASADSRHARTRLALDLQVFGSSSPALPATLMGYTR